MLAFITREFGEFSFSVGHGHQHVHVLHRDAWQQMPGQRVVCSMIGELAVALPSAVEAALALAAYSPLF